jgi:hypothetical protein
MAPRIGVTYFKAELNSAETWRSIAAKMTELLSTGTETFIGNLLFNGGG